MNMMKKMKKIVVGLLTVAMIFACMTENAIPLAAEEAAEVMDTTSHDNNTDKVIAENQEEMLPDEMILDSFAVGESSGQCGDNLTWVFDETSGRLTISGTGEMSDYPGVCGGNHDLIRSVVVNEGVTSIGNYAFSVCRSITSIMISDSVTNIGDGAFSSCSSLTSITIPDSVTSIGNYAFSGCDSLTSITIPDSVTSIGNSAFSVCSSLKSITIPDSITNIGNYAFSGCSSLTSITIPDSVTSIGNYAFSGCGSLTSITIPDGVTNIGNYAFEGCSSLKSITIPDSVTNIGEGTFCNCISLTSTTIPDGVTNIGNYAFEGCSSLKSVTIPDSVTSIGDGAFRACSSLKSITIPDSVTNIGEGTFCNCSSLTSTTIPDGVTNIGNHAFEGCSSLKSITIPDSVTNIGDSAFCGCFYLTNVTIPNSVTSIGVGAFQLCYRLTSITISDRVTSIESSLFSGCNGLTNITIPNNVTSIGDRAFIYCTSLTSITIPDTVSSIGQSAFNNCNFLKDIYYTGSKEKWEAISIESGNDSINQATIHFNSSGSDEPTTYYTVSFETNGGTAVSPKKVASGKKLAIFEDPKKDNYTFVGWYTDEALTKAYDFNTPVTSDLILYAKWVEKQNTDDLEEDKIKTINTTFKNYADNEKPLQIKWTFADFKDTAYKYNQRIAIAGLALSAAAELSEGAQEAENILSQMGFSDFDSDWYDDRAIAQPGYTIASRNISVDGEERVLVTVTISGTRADDMGDILTDIQAIVNGFQYAGGNVKERLNDYVNNHVKKNYGDDAEIILFITGHSYGAAVAGWLAQNVNHLAGGTDTYVYTYASPCYDTKNGNYTNVHNIINVDDPVPNEVITKTRVGMDYRYNANGGGTAFNKAYKMLTGFNKTYSEIQEMNQDNYVIGTVLSTIISLAKNFLLPAGNSYAAIAHDVRAYMAFLLSNASLSEIKSRYYKVLHAACPVDIDVYDEEGNFAGSVKNGVVSYPEYTDLVILTDGDEKYIYMPYGTDYQVRLTGSDNGHMTYEVSTVDSSTDAIVSEKVFKDVELNDGKVMQTSIHEDINVNDTKLYLLDEETGEKEKEILQNGTEIEYDPSEDPDNCKSIKVKGLETSYPYTGKPIKPEFFVYHGKDLLTEKTDYTVSYKNNTKPGEAEIQLKLKGNLTGTKKLFFTIDPCDLSTVTADEPALIYKKGKLQKVVPTLYLNGEKLKYAKGELLFTWPDADADGKTAYLDAGKYKVHIEGDGKKFSGSMDVPITITENAIPISGVSVKVTGSLNYTGEAVDPKLVLSYKGKALVCGTDYTLEYLDSHTSIGKHAVILRGNGTDIVGTKQYIFQIKGKYDIEKAVASAIGEVPYVSSGAKPVVTLTFGGKTLQSGKDYTVTYQDNKAVGSAKAIVKGKGSYAGTKTIPFTIVKQDIEDLSLQMEDMAYQSKAGKYFPPKLIFTDRNYVDQKLKKDKDYKIELSEKPASETPTGGTMIRVTITGIGDNYTGTVSDSYRIIDKTKDFTKAKITVNGGKPYAYTGKAIRPEKSELKVMIGNQELDASSYEILGVYHNVAKGTAVLRIIGDGDYAGVKTVKFQIVAASGDSLWM